MSRNAGILQTPLSRPLAIHHLALGARDVERVAGFYSSVFGLPETQRHFTEDGAIRSIWLQLDRALLMIERTTRCCETVAGVDAGLFLMAFRVERETRVQLEEHLAALGHPVESRTEHTSYFRDPEGNRFAISHFPDCGS
jgi:glyoxylase I family protein